MISIQPKWCELIACGKKTIEVRKTRPKIDTPFKCYIYCSKSKPYLYKNPNNNELFLDKDLYRGGVYEDRFLSGKVIGEFVCDGIYGIFNFLPYDADDIHHDLLPYVLEQTCLQDYEIDEYLGAKDGYGWHISDLVIYDKPKELGEFESAFHCFNLKNVEAVENAFGDYVVKYWDNSFCRICKYYNGDFGDCDKRAYQPLTKPPQGWCYVEEKENE